MRITRILGTAALIAASYLVGCGRGDSKLQSWNEYKGSIPCYDVRIEETKRNGNKTRTVHLESQGPGTVPFAVTGHDFKIDNKYERIFMRRVSADGYNSVWFEDNDTIWEPCPADEGRVEPFTPSEIKTADSLLHLAVSCVRLNENQRDLLKTFENK